MKYTRYPLTMPQFNIHSQEMAFQGTDINVLYFVILMEDNLHEEELRKAVEGVVNKNIAVRTRICMEETPAQYFVAEENTSIPVMDLSNLEVSQREQLYQKWGQIPFTYLDSPLWEFKMLKLSEQECGLFCKFHHIWCDGWSTGLIWSEILTEYCRLKEGAVDIKLPGLQSQDKLISFIQKSEGYKNSDEQKTSRQFFLEYLKGVEPCSHFAAERKSFGEAAEKLEIGHLAKRSPVYPVPQELSKEIHTFCERWKVTPYTVFMGALAVYEGGISARDDVVLGMARLNRDTQAERQTVGEFVVELPLRVHCDSEITFARLCQNILLDSRAVAVHKKYSMTHILKDQRMEEGVRGAFIRHSLSFQREKIDLDGYLLPVKIWFGSPSVCVEDAVVHVVDLLENGYQVFYDYCRALYQETTILNLHESLMEIMKMGIKGDTKISELPLVGENERKALCAPSNETLSPVSEEETILTMLKTIVKKKTNEVAISGRDGSFSFSETWEKSDSVAACLTAFGIENEETVGVFLPRIGAAIISLLGIIKAGGSFVLLDQNYPPNRVQAIIKDSRMKYVITDKKGAKKLGGCLQTIEFDEIPEAIFEEKPISQNQRCYMIYTSGTTGKPKGVQIEHRAIYNLLQPSHTELVADVARRGRRAVAIGAFSFDIFLFEIFTNLMNGVSVIIADEGEIENPFKLAVLMEREQVDVIYGTPSRLLSYCEVNVFHKALRNIKIMLSAGEAFPEALYQKVQDLNPAIHIYNGYGPTETAIGTSFQRVKGDTITLGKPVANYKLRCLDPRGRILPYGAIGELYIGGAGLARGYTDLALTKQSFVEIKGERFYKSGDLVCRRLDDELLFAGRRDNQVKVRGFRIELAEIEDVLRSHAAVRNAAVLVKKKGNSEYLCAFYTSEYKVEIEELKKLLSKRLPYYMVPSVFQNLEKMPMTVNGKADIKRLSQVEIEYEQLYKAPETELQKSLTVIVEKVLGLEKVGIDDDFFDIGGDSLSVAQYAVEVLAQGIKFEYSEVFRYPTVRRFSEYIDQQTQKSSVDVEVEEYDYSKINQLLESQKNKLNAIRPINHVLLTGATGYLGMHVLYELLNSTNATVYCLVRKKDKYTPQKYLNGRYYYYFEEVLLEIPKERLEFCTGDVAEDDLSELFKGITLDTVINCAADVAHYTYGTRMQKVNTESLKGIVTLCKEKDANLIHISTISVGQFGSTSLSMEKEQFSERDLYFAQDLSNEYIRSKFLAERIVLEEMAKGELKGFIARVGNLQGRYSDGEFQINFKSNAFLTRLKSYVRIGFMPKSETEGTVDYSPIDYVARAICLLAGYQGERSIYHILNNKETENFKFFEVLKNQGHVIEVLQRESYEKRISELLASDSGKELLADMAADLTAEMDGKHLIHITSKESADILKGFGFKWPEIEEKYLELYVKGIEMLGLFDEEE